MDSIVFHIAESDPASRQSAARLRARVEGEALAGKRVVIDLAEVLSISESYADELFGVLVARHDLAWLAKNVVIQHAAPFVFRAIAEAIRDRLQAQSPEEPDIALLTARKALEARRNRSNL